MIRSWSFSVAVLVAALLWSPSLASAQTAGRVALSGEVRGVELSMVGGMSAPRGGTLRWLLTAYEVVGLSELRIAANAEIQLTHALARTAEPLTVRTDARGRAVVELPIPEDAPPTFGVVVRVVSGQAQRRFELSISTWEPRTLEVRVARQMVPRGGVVHAFGRLGLAPVGSPVEGETVALVLRDGQSRPVGAPVMVRTDASGAFAHAFRVPREVQGQVAVEARTGQDERELSAMASTTVGDVGMSGLVVGVSPAQHVVAPESDVPVEVVVRTVEGRPVAGATVVLQEAYYDRDAARVRTDARGRARLSWHAPAMTDPWSDVSISVRVAHEVHGDGDGSALVRLATVEHAASVAVEGGALLPSIGGRVWVRVVGIDGRPAAAGVPVELTGPRLTTARAATDASGIATFDVTLGTAVASDRCGGTASTQLRASVGTGGRLFTLDTCVPLDPDGVVRARAADPMIRVGGTVRVDVTRAPIASGLPVALTLLAEGTTAVAMHVLAPNETSAELSLPASVAGPVVIRARALHGTAQREARGGSGIVLVMPADPAELGATLSADGSARLTGTDGSTWVVALPLDEARSLAAQLQAELLGPAAELRVPLAIATDAMIAAALSVRTPLDTSAPFVLRPAATGRTAELVPVPAPEDPASQGLLRDPWRAQSRFVTGRLALVFSAIERHVAASVPEHLDDVAVQSGGRWDFNAQILAAIADGGDLGSEGATGLGGEPLTADALRRFDAAFTYDAVARRITRSRLYRLLVLMRHFVNESGFDLPWARLGDPSTWLRHLPHTHADGVSVQQRELVDGWGRPFVLRAVPRARFTAWTPLAGWELASAGPNGRIGDADDVVDPTARVLPSASAYAQAVGEDALVARLTGVELGRATVDLLSGATHERVGGIPYRPEGATQAIAGQLWSALPGLLDLESDPLALRRPARPGEGAGGVLVTGAEARLALDDEPRDWGLVALSYGAHGWPSIAEARVRAGAALIVEARLPRRLRTGGDARLPLHITNTEERDHQLTLEVRGEGPIAGDGTSLALAAGTSQRTEVTLRATGVGSATATLVVRDGDAILRTIPIALDTDDGTHAIRVRAGAALPEGRWSTSLAIPAGARDPVGRVVLVHPAWLARDPDLADARESDPALVAWSTAMSGRPLEPALRARLLAMQDGNGMVQGSDPGLATACALVAWSAADVDDRESREAAQRARWTLGSSWWSNMEGVRGMAATLAALAPGGSFDLADATERELDPVQELTARLRRQLRRALRDTPEEPTLLARAAAALLLADPRDEYARAMVERVRASLAPAENGVLLTPSEERAQISGESLVASLALAVALHQLDDDATAAHLVSAVLASDHVVIGRGGEGLFWLLASGAYGALGGGDVSDARVSIDGRVSTPEWHDGVAIVELPTPRAGSTVSVDVRASGPAILARAEVVTRVPFAPRDGGWFALEVHGDAGDGESLAALELTIRALREVDGGVLHLQLPAGVEADEELLALLGRVAGVAEVEPRRPGLVRIRVGAMAAGTELVIPLPFRFTVLGIATSPHAAIAPLSDPGAMTVL